MAPCGHRPREIPTATWRRSVPQSAGTNNRDGRQGYEKCELCGKHRQKVHVLMCPTLNGIVHVRFPRLAVSTMHREKSLKLWEPKKESRSTNCLPDRDTYHVMIFPVHRSPANASENVITDVHGQGSFSKRDPDCVELYHAKASKSPVLNLSHRNKSPLR